MRCTGFVKAVALLGCIVLAEARAQEEKRPDELKTIAAKVIETLLADPKQSARIAGGEADKVVAALPDAYTGLKKYGFLDAAYRALKPEVKQQPEHALKARLLAALARAGRQRAADISQAEELDLLLNPDHPDAWLRRGISYAKAREERYATDMFLEALKRTDFARPPEFFTTLAPPSAGWVARIAKAQRIDELNVAIGEAFARTKQGAAGPMAFSMLQAVLDMEDTPKQPQRLESMLKSVREHQQHLMLSHMAQFQQRVMNWNRLKQYEAAATLARALLLTPMSGGEVIEQEAGGGRQDFPQKDPTVGLGLSAQLPSVSFWGSTPGEVGYDGFIPSLTHSALREPREAFLAEAEEAARKHPGDAHLISTVLLLKAYTKALTPESLRLADGLDVASRPQVAWRLAVLAGTDYADPKLLAPWCEKGLVALLQREDGKGRTGGEVRQVIQMLPWLEKQGCVSTFASLVPALCERMVKERELGNGDLNRDLWPSLVVLAAVHGRPQDKEACMKAWQLGHASRRATVEEEWNECRRGLRVLVDGMNRVSPEQASELARLAFELWCQIWPRSMKEGASNGAAAMLVQDALMSANLREELATFEQQVLKEITFGREFVFQPILDRLRWHHSVLKAEGNVVPPSRVKVLEAMNEQEGPRISWSYAVQTEDVERIRLEFLLSDDPVSPQGMREEYEPPLLHALTGRYDMEVYAGEMPQALRKVGEAKAVPVQGELPVKDLPLSGWLRIVMKDPKSGSTSFGEPQLYCLHPAELDSGKVLQEPPLAWGVIHEEQFGIPNTQPIAIEPDTEYLLRVDLPDHLERHYERTLFPDGIRLVALDEKKQPIGSISGIDDKNLAENVGRYMGLIRPDRWVNRSGYLCAIRDSEEWEGEVKPRYLVFTSKVPGMSSIPVRLQKYRQIKPGLVPERLPELKAEFLAAVELQARTWFVSNLRPRAAVGGAGSIKVYDTSATPWVLLKHLQSNTLVGRESVFLFRDDVLICVEWPYEGRPQAALRVIPLNSELGYDAHERRVLPMNPLRSEVAVDESGVIFTAPSEGAFRTKFRALWLSGNGEVLETAAERPVMDTASEVTVAWWGKDGTLGISEGGRMFHLKVTPEALTVEKQEPGVASFETVPPGAEPSSHLWQPRFKLKEDRILLRLDQKTGELLSGYRLPYRCNGSVIWMGDAKSPALLTTDQGELIRVAVPEYSAPGAAR